MFGKIWLLAQQPAIDWSFVTSCCGAVPDEYDVTVKQLLDLVAPALVNLSLDLLTLLLHRDLLVHVAHHCKLNQGGKHEEEAAGQVDVYRLHVRYLGHVRIRRGDESEQG